MILGQNHHERILKAHLEALGTKVEFGSELRSFTESADSVSVEIVRHVDGKEVVERSEGAGRLRLGAQRGAQDPGLEFPGRDEGRP